MDSDIGTNWIVAPWIASLIIKYYLRTYEITISKWLHAHRIARCHCYHWNPYDNGV